MYIYIYIRIHKWPLLGIVVDGIKADGQYTYWKLNLLKQTKGFVSLSFGCVFVKNR